MRDQSPKRVNPPREKTGRIRKGMMSWKKNAISYLIWFVYTIMTGTALLALAREVRAIAGLPDYMGIPIAAAYVAVAGGIAFLLHRFAVGQNSFAEEKRVHLTVLGAVLAVGLLAAGFVLRLQAIGGVEYSSSVYYEAAKVTEGQRIPQSVHGAVYFYVWFLHGIFLLLGNHAVAGIWVQIVLQLAASVLLFLAVRRLSGFIAGLVVLGFCMCGPYMVDNCLVLSPDMLYFFLMAAALWLMALGYGDRKPREEGEAQGLNLAVCFFSGVLAALCCYVDILGILLLLPAFGGIFRCRRDEPAARRKAVAALLCGAGTVLGFGTCILLDAVTSGKAVERVATAWFSMYQQSGFRLPTEVGVSDSLAEGCVLFGVMAFGIFSFWFDKGKERMSVAMLAACGIVALCCFGVFTEELPGFFFLYVALALLAGIGFGQCFYAEPAAREKEATGEEEKPDWEILMESREDAASEKGAAEAEGQVRFLENPLPLPKKHIKRVMDYSLSSVSQEDDFDYPVAEDDDFDI